MILYLITNTVNGKQYVGITNGTLKRRFGDHVLASKRPRVPLHLALAKYGCEAFRVEELARGGTREELCAMERDEIARRGTLAPAGYNLTPGGDGQSPGYVTPESARKLIGARSKAAWARLSPEERAERGRRISEAKKGRPRRTSGPSPLLGTIRSPEFKSKVSDGIKQVIERLPEGEMSRRSKLAKRDGTKTRAYWAGLAEEQRQNKSDAIRKRIAQLPEGEMSRRARLNKAPRVGAKRSRGE